MKKIIQYTHAQNWIFSFICLFLILSPVTLLAEISIDSYCQLTIETMQQQIPQTQELISIVQENKNNPEALESLLVAKRAEFDLAREALYSSYGTSAQEFVTYINRNGKSVKAYLEANQNIKQQIDNLAAQLNILMEEEDALRPNQEVPDELPLPIK